MLGIIRDDRKMPLARFDELMRPWKRDAAADQSAVKIEKRGVYAVEFMHVSGKPE
ncbi:hypothetical protein [Rhizobium sp. AN80A]|uniref:hypothetical protein n=1 Tax=Rhizobium sp. AN80A TaxID=3040673 RepID=UPI0024B35A32|nr:hypothetical protein [Rhizobium sp. AN80A]